MWFWIMSRSTPVPVVVVAAPLDADRLGDGELDVVDVVLVPQRLEDAVGEAEGEQVLHRLLAEVMVDAVDLLLRPVGQQLAVELDGRGEVVAEGLLDDESRPPLGPVAETGPIEVARRSGRRPRAAWRDKECGCRRSDVRRRVAEANSPAVGRRRGRRNLRRRSGGARPTAPRPRRRTAGVSCNGGCRPSCVPETPR